MASKRSVTKLPCTPWLLIAVYSTCDADPLYRRTCRRDWGIFVCVPDYAAITHQQYAAAYSHLDTRFTFNGTLITEQSYSQATTRRDATEGKMINYSISNVSTSWNFGQNIASATVHVIRACRSYDVHLALKLEGNTYKITNFDDI
jgi:hypothetical protein